MYTCIHRVYMWEVEPTLYWRVKKNGKWTWVRATVVDKGCCEYPKVMWIYPEVSESEK